MDLLRFMGIGGVLNGHLVFPATRTVFSSFHSHSSRFLIGASSPRMANGAATTMTGRHGLEMVMGPMTRHPMSFYFIRS